VELELSPAQPSEVDKAIAALLPQPSTAPGAWWEAGIEEALYGETTARPRSTRGADLA
jgi:hypothetical protein